MVAVQMSHRGEDQPPGCTSHPWYHWATVSDPSVCENTVVKLLNKNKIKQKLERDKRGW